MSFKGMKSNTVKEIFPEIIVKAEKLIKENKNCHYVGIKNTNVISIDFINSLQEIGLLKHTVDTMSDDGRAIDLNVLNPITGRLMTGSSSSTAVNVFLGINDIGIGTDGGGSVLAPALSLNLYGFISNLFDEENIKRYIKESTDGIKFSPSMGFISKNLENIEYVVNNTICKNELVKNDEKYNIRIARPKTNQQIDLYNKLLVDLDEFPIQNIELSYNSIDRYEMVKDLSNFDFDNNILITFEGPVDLYEYGDSIMGHYSKYTKNSQALAHKYYLKIINMMKLSAFAIPSKDLSVGNLVICKSDNKNIMKALEVAKSIKFERSKLEEKYFS